MIAVSNVSLAFGGRIIFDEINFLISRGDKIGLVGRNGAGKSTLLKIIKGIQAIDSGSVMYPKETVIGYLPQELQLASELTVMEETQKAFENILNLKCKRNALIEELENRSDYESDAYMEIINQLQETEHRLELYDADKMDEQTERVLKGLGFEDSDMNKQVRELSGGWQMRVELAKIILQKPDVILLDEPTNHLDIESVIWLENFLNEFSGAIMMVSHDKTFLDNVTNRTIEIVQGRIEDYPVSYSPYITLRKERKEQLANAAKNQQREIARMERNIERFRAKANKASFAQSLIKKLEKMERIETEEDDGFFLNLRFPPASPSGKIVLTAEQISKSFDQKKVIQNQSLILQRGEKVAFVGKNGTGKTTFSRILVNNLVPDSGKVTHGHNVIIGYYAQHATESLNPDETVLDTVDKVATGEIRTKLRDLLGAFLFRGDEVYKKVKVLSGGEKSRLALCKMILEPANLLVLDEPTNHLDMPSKEILKQALKNFDGSVLIVSHDRDFLDGLAEKIFEFSKEGIKEHLGDINYFLQKKAAENMRAWEAQRDSKNRPLLQPEKNLKGKSPENGNSKQLKQKLSQIEKQIDALEKKIKDAEEKLNQPDLYESLNNNNDFFEQYEKLKRELHDLMHQWELIYAAIESSA